MEEGIAMVLNLYDLFERIAHVLPEALNTFRAQTPQGFVATSEKLLEVAVVHLEEQGKNLRKSSEDNITSSAIGFFNRYGIRASSQTNSRGHVDIYICHSYLPALVICGEAKIWDGVVYHIGGLSQVLGYCTGRMPNCFLLAYVTKGKIDQQIRTLQAALDKGLPEQQQGLSSPHASMRWTLVTSHLHSGSGEVKVLHAGVNLC